MATLTLGGKTVLTQTGSDEPVLGSNLTGSPNFDFSNSTFPTGHIINIQEFTNSDTTDTWTSSNWRTICSSVYSMSSASNKLLFFINAYVGLSNIGQQLYGQITYKAGTSTTFTHDGTPLPEGVNSISGNTNIQRVPFQWGNQSAYSNGDETAHGNGSILHSPGTTDSRQYQLQARSRTDDNHTCRVNACSTITNGGYENYGVTRMTIMEIQQ